MVKQHVLLEEEFKYNTNNSNNANNNFDSTIISYSELNFIDLAGSEKVSNHQNIEDLLVNSA